MTIPRIKIWSAALAIACAALCALTIIAALWLEWNDLLNARGGCSPWLTRRQSACATARSTRNTSCLV